MHFFTHTQLHLSNISSSLPPNWTRLFISLLLLLLLLMALETLLIKVKTVLSHKLDSVRPSSSSHPKLLLKISPFKSKNVGVLTFEIAGIMSKLLHLWQSLCDTNIIRLRNDSIALEGVRKIISNDESFLLGLACAEFTHNLKLVSNSISRISRRCQDSNLRSFDRLFQDFADYGRDPNGWALTSPKEIELKHKKMERFVTISASLYKEMDELSALENSLRKISLHNENDASSPLGNRDQKIYELQQKISWQKQEVKDLKERSIWNKSFDSIVSLLVRSIFTILARIKLVFGIGHCVPSLSRSLSTSAAVYPSDQNPTFISTPSTKSPHLYDEKKDSASGFFKSNQKLLKPPESTLGAAALALHYANLIIVMEKMIKSPQLVGVDARDDLYSMLPDSIRSSLRRRLRGVGFSASDPGLAGEWREALGRILGWLSPMAHNMIKWQSERSFEQQNSMQKTNVLLLQTLFFANKEKTEAAITELLVGLNYIWRFEREMTAKALFECNNLQ